MAQYLTTAFVPSSYSGLPYGDAEGTTASVSEAPPAEDTSGEMLAEYMPALKSFLGMEDPRERAAKFEARLKTLKQGGPAAIAAAWSAGALGNVSVAIQKTEGQLREARSQANQMKTRDALYTALTLTGVVAGSMVALWLGTKTWSGYQEGKIRQVKLKRLQAGG